MSKVFDLITSRLKRGDKTSKMAELAEQSKSGQLSSFAGIFGTSELSPPERDNLEGLLEKYATGEETLSKDLESLISITSEVKAINNQAVILHGERIKRAQTLLKPYRDGAFTQWLKLTYGNRQTPYNFLQYFEFYTMMPKHLRPRIEDMPRQAIYTLASRDGATQDKQDIVENYAGETKEALIAQIREVFPLSLEDKRRQDIGENVLQGLKRLAILVKRSRSKTKFSDTQKQAVKEVLESLLAEVDDC